MRFYLAPLEGITGHIYRNAVEKYFPGTDRYFTPFIAPDENKILRKKETKDVLPENNHTKDLIPQVLTNNPEHFRKTAEALADLGYQEVNLNFGCPSGTVVSRKRGSGILAYPQELDGFLEQVFYDNPDIKISVKTRIGRDDTEYAAELMRIYRKYPLSELIIHPRTQKDFYRGVPRTELFGELLDQFEKPIGYEDENKAGLGIPVCYNGNILTEPDYHKFTGEFPKIGAVMLGRGMIANPGLIRQLKTGIPTDKKTLHAFLDEIAGAYREAYGEDRNVLFRMKEIWIYMNHLFADSEKYMKKLRKSQSLAEYRVIVDGMFANCELQPMGPEYWNLPTR